MSGIQRAEYGAYKKRLLKTDATQGMPGLNLAGGPTLHTAPFCQLLKSTQEDHKCSQKHFELWAFFSQKKKKSFLKICCVYFLECIFKCYVNRDEEK